MQLRQLIPFFGFKAFKVQCRNGDTRAKILGPWDRQRPAHVVDALVFEWLSHGVLLWHSKKVVWYEA